MFQLDGTHFLKFIIDNLTFHKWHQPLLILPFVKCFIFLLHRFINNCTHVRKYELQELHVFHKDNSLKEFCFPGHGVMVAPAFFFFPIFTETTIVFQHRLWPYKVKNGQWTMKRQQLDQVT